MARGKTKKKPESFDFTYEGKAYSIKQKYNAEPAKIVLDDGKVLHVRLWNLLPLLPVPDRVEEFDPQTQDAAQLAAEPGAFLAEVAEVK